MKNRFLGRKTIKEAKIHKLNKKLNDFDNSIKKLLIGLLFGEGSAFPKLIKLLFNRAHRR